jgi:hypothetical protein
VSPSPLYIPSSSGSTFIYWLVCGGAVIPLKKKLLLESMCGYVPSKLLSLGGVFASSSDTKVYLVTEKRRSNQENLQVCRGVYPSTLPATW